MDAKNGYEGANNFNQVLMFKNDLTIKNNIIMVVRLHFESTVFS